MCIKKEINCEKQFKVYCAWCSSFMYKVNVENNIFEEKRSHGTCQTCINKYFEQIYKKL